MPFKPNYRMQRADRDRAKEEKLKRKLERRAEKIDAPDDAVIDTANDDAQAVATVADVPVRVS
jgi:hypothetical protein